MDNRPWIKRYDKGVPVSLEYLAISVPEVLEERFGRVPDTPFLDTGRDSGTTMLPNWQTGCRIADAGGHTSSAGRFTWWTAWKRHVFYSVAPAGSPAPAAAAACDSLTCLFVADEAGAPAPPGHRFAVLVAGPPLLFDSRRQSRSALADLDAREWLEGANADLRRLNANPAAPDCDADPSLPAGPASPSHNRLATHATRTRNDVVAVGP